MVESIFPYERWNARLPSWPGSSVPPIRSRTSCSTSFSSPSRSRAPLAPSRRSRIAGGIHYTHFNEQKFGKSDRRVIPAELAAVIDELNSPRFVAFLEGLTEIPALLADPGLMGGGLHQSAAGGYLNVHADFTGHPHRPSWRRRLNLLLYLNDDWRDSYGGSLELWDAAMQRCVQRIAPIFNRAVIFRTSPDSFHGHPDPITCPPTSLASRSLCTTSRRRPSRFSFARPSTERVPAKG